jgi:hypothetical protein
MKNEPGFVSANNLDHNPHKSSQAREHALNAALINANISESYEEYLKIFDEFYGDDIEAASETGEEPIRGKAEVRSIIANFLVPLHLMAEVGGLLVSIRQTSIPGDAADETHSAWILEMVGVSRKSCIVSWRTLRQWNGSHVVYEYHYDHQQIGCPLTSEDLSFYAPTSATADQRPS